MTKHYVLNLDPKAKYDWERCTLRDPITAEHPALAALVAQAIGEESGSYLIAVKLEVSVLEKADVEQVKQVAAAVALPNRAPLPQLKELVA